MGKTLADALVEMFETGYTDFQEKVTHFMPPSPSPFGISLPAAQPTTLLSGAPATMPVSGLAAFGITAPAPRPGRAPAGSRRGQFICIIGKPGIGKSSWAAEWPDAEVIITDRDQGMLDLEAEGLLPKSLEINMATSFGSFKTNLEAAINGPKLSIICEDLRGMQSLCLDHCSNTDHGGDWSPKSFLSYQAGPIAAADHYFQELVDIMKRGQSKGKHVIVVGHSRSISQDNKTGEDWLTDTLEMDKRFSAIVSAQFMNIFHIVDAVPVVRLQGKAKATSDTSRWMYTNVNPFYFAKNRMGLVGECEFPSTPREAYLSYCRFAKRDPKTGYKIGA